MIICNMSQLLNKSLSQLIVDKDTMDVKVSVPNGKYLKVQILKSNIKTERM